MTKDVQQQLKEQLKQEKIEVEVDGSKRGFAVFERFPDFVPYIAKGYGAIVKRYSSSGRAIMLRTKRVSKL